MSISGSAKKLTLYTGETQHWKGKPLYHALILKLKEHGIMGATATRGIEGYGLDKQLHTARILDLSADLPIIVEAVDTEEKIRKVLPAIQEMLSQGMITMTDLEVIPVGSKASK
ncbi:MAG: DUF190 domain-containing protein [Bacillota bacterium]